MVTNREREERRGKMGVEVKVVTISVKLASYKEIQSLFYNIYKWNKTFKKYEALYCIPVTCIYQLCIIFM